jgi:hypothetical protein
MDFNEPKKRSLGALRIATKTKPTSPDLTGQLNLQRHTFEAIANQFEETDGDSLKCCIAGWKNQDGSGPYLTVELSPKYVKQESRPIKSKLSFLFKGHEEDA